MTLSSKIALVTGSGRGIGRGCALELARAGADLVINDLPPLDDAHETARLIKDLGRRAHVVEADLARRENCERLVAETVAHFGRLDILVSNPAYNFRRTFLEYPPEEFQKVIDIALLAGFHVSQFAARQLVRQGTGGKIIFISSVHAILPIADCVAYNACKAGLEMLAASIANELADHKINVNVIQPGWIDTPGERNFYTEEQLQAAGPLLPWRRLGRPEDIGRAAAFLASGSADYITGTILRVDGGVCYLGARGEPSWELGRAAGQSNTGATDQTDGH